jgi:hypothetical protein
LARHREPSQLKTTVLTSLHPVMAAIVDIDITEFFDASTAGLLLGFAVIATRLVARFFGKQ